MKVRLGDIASIVSGGTPKSAVSDYWGGNIQWVTPADLSNLAGAYISTTPRTLTESGLRNSSAVILPPGSVLLSSRAPIGHVAITSAPMATNQGFKSLVPLRDRAEPKYLYYWLRANKALLQSLGNGATFKELSKAAVERVEVPLPPLEEQRRIAALLDHADTLRVKRRQMLTHMRSLNQSLFMSMFGEPDKAAEMVSFGDIASLRGGRNLVAEDSGADTPYRVLKISAVTSGQFRSSESKPLPWDYRPPADHIVRAGDLLMSRANTAELVGAVAHVDQVAGNLVLPDKIWRFEWHDTASNATFYRVLLQTPAIRRRISRMASGTGGSMKNVSKTKLAHLKLPAVSFAEQRDFATQIEKIEVQRNNAERALALEDELFASLQWRAFRGEL